MPMDRARRQLASPVLTMTPICKFRRCKSTSQRRCLRSGVHSGKAIQKRTPSELRKYLGWTTAIKAKYGFMVNYIAQERLRWGPMMDTKGVSVANPDLVPKNAAPFADEADYKILRNDWPYGCDPGIHHLVVWMKTKVPVKPENGSLTPESREIIQSFVDKTFVQPLARTNGGKPQHQVLWFKDWTALQSVTALEHFHVMVRDVSDEQLIAWTGKRKVDEKPFLCKQC